MACCPYGSKPVIILAQILSVISLILTLDGFWFTWFCGLVATILLLCLACSFVNPFLVFTAGNLSLLCAIGQFLFAGYIRDLFVYCNMHDDNPQGSNIYQKANNNMCDITTWRTVAIVGGVGWTLTSLLVCCIVPTLKESDPVLQRNNNTTTNNNNLGNQGATPVVYGVPYGNAPSDPYSNASSDPYGNVASDPYSNAASDPYSNAASDPYSKVPISTTETFLVLPDGTKHTEKVTTNADGSKTVTVTEERPAYP